jgi:uncharacterized membrane protein YfcA
MHLVILFIFLLIGVANGFINVTGGGGGLITTPLLLAFGLSPYASLATSKFVPIGGLLAGGAKYYKEKVVRRNKALVILAIVVSIGAIIAANLTLSINEQLLKYIILTATATIIALTIFSKENKNVSKSAAINTPNHLSFGVLFWSFIVSLYQGSIGIGGGIFLAFVFRKFMRYSYLESAALMNVLSALVTIISAVTFTIKGVVNYEYGVPLFLGSIFGGYLGAHIAIKKGEKLLKIITIVVSVGLLVKILLT